RQLLLRDEAVPFRGVGGECEDVEPRDVIGDDDLGPVRREVLDALDMDADTGRAEEPARPPARYAIVEAGRCTRVRPDDDEQAQRDRGGEDVECEPGGADHDGCAAKWSCPVQGSSTTAPSSRSITPAPSCTLPTQVSGRRNVSVNASTRRSTA